MSCTKEEIERKRLAALQKRHYKVGVSSPLKPVSFPQNVPFQGPSTSFHETTKPYSPRPYSNAARKTTHPYSKPETNGMGSKAETSSFLNKVISGTIYLISEDRFEVNPSEFCSPLINIFKTIPSKSYDSITKLWNFSVNDYHDLMKKVAPLAPDVVLGVLPSFVLKALNEVSIDPSSIDLSPIESTLRNKLMPFQAEGVRFGIAKRGRCMIADDMGLGKTFQALAIASYYRHNWPLLIVTTSSMRDTWQSKIHELLPSIPMMNIVSLTNHRDATLAADRQTDVVVTSYKICTTHAELLRNKGFGVVIIDESHSLKSHKAQCTIALTKISSKASRVILLSGSPALSRPSELYTQLHVIQQNYFGGYTEFGKRYCAGKMTNFGWDMSGQSHLAELQVILQKKFLIRRTKDQVLTSLEDKTRESIILDQSLLQFTKEDEQDLSQMAETYKRNSSNDKHAALLTFFSESSRVKIPAVCKYIRQLTSDPSAGKFLVFAHHREMVGALCDVLDDMGERYICITGATPAKARADLVDKFQYNESCRAAVLSITAANSGLTLTAASLVLFAELHWNPGILTQAEARAHRIGQRGQVRVRYLLAPSTSDDYMWPMLQNKLNVLNEVGLSKDRFDGTKQTLQESKNNITQYLTPSRDTSDFIPGTNIRRNSLTNRQTKQTFNTDHNISDTNFKSNGFCDADLCDVNFSDVNFSDIDLNVSDSQTRNNENEKSFLEDDEGDALLANLDL